MLHSKPTLQFHMCSLITYIISILQARIQLRIQFTNMAGLYMILFFFKLPYRLLQIDFKIYLFKNEQPNRLYPLRLVFNEWLLIPSLLKIKKEKALNTNLTEPIGLRKPNKAWVKAMSATTLCSKANENKIDFRFYICVECF